MGRMKPRRNQQEIILNDEDHYNYPSDKYICPFDVKDSDMISPRQRPRMWEERNVSQLPSTNIYVI